MGSYWSQCCGADVVQQLVLVPVLQLQVLLPVVLTLVLVRQFLLVVVVLAIASYLAASQYIYTTGSVYQLLVQ